MVHYVPSPREIEERSEILRWMQQMEWDLDVIDSILYHDHPSPDTVRCLVYRHGPQKAYKLLKGMVD